MQITWKDSGATPAISALTTYTLQLMVGGNTDDTSVGTEPEELAYRKHGEERAARRGRCWELGSAGEENMG